MPEIHYLGMDGRPYGSVVHVQDPCGLADGASSGREMVLALKQGRHTCSAAAFKYFSAMR